MSIIILIQFIREWFSSQFEEQPNDVIAIRIDVVLLVHHLCESYLVHECEPLACSHPTRFNFFSIRCLWSCEYVLALCLSSGKHVRQTKYHLIDARILYQKHSKSERRSNVTTKRLRWCEAGCVIWMYCERYCSSCFELWIDFELLTNNRQYILIWLDRNSWREQICGEPIVDAIRQHNATEYTFSHRTRRELSTHTVSGRRASTTSLKVG